MKASFELSSGVQRSEFIDKDNEKKIIVKDILRPKLRVREAASRKDSIIIFLTNQLARVQHDNSHTNIYLYLLISNRFISN